MDSEISKYLNKKNNNEKKKKSILISFFNKVLVCFILVIICLILMKNNNDFKNFISKNVFHDNISFAYINNLYNKYFGNVLPKIETEGTTTVFNEKLAYSNYNKYFDGYKLDVANSYLVPIIESGIVVYSGNMDNYGNVVIIEGIDGVDIWYGNINNLNVKLYDYVTKGNFLGETVDNTLYLVFEKDKEYLNFEDYIKD
ncbi:MAG: M23 family metallopeptidase [Bacilli bacterium]|nr:M23 family metallopeptidase [Bacilli bacterium]